MTSTRTRNIKTLDIIRENNMIPKSSEYSNLNKKVCLKDGILYRDIWQLKIIGK